MLFRSDHIAARLEELPPIVVLRLRNMTAIDATGVQALEQFVGQVQKTGRAVLLCGAPEQPRQFMERANFAQHVGERNLCANINEALDRARAIFAEIGGSAPSAEKWGRRAGEHGKRGGGASVAAVEL